MLQWVENHQAQLTQFAADLVATPSPNLPGDERAVVATILAEMKKLGLPGAEIVAKEPHRPNVIFRLRGGRPGPVLMLCGHSDTKPVGDPSLWLTDPFQPVVKEGKREFEQPPLDWIPPTEVPADHPFVTALLEASEQVLGRRPKLSAFPGGTDASVICFPNNHSEMHQLYTFSPISF